MSTLSQLEYALAVEKHQHFGKAALACHVSQPTLSQQIQKIEEELGIQLFDRARKPVIPTPEGRHFLEQAKVVRREHEKLLGLSRGLAKGGGLTGEFRLAIIPTIASFLIPRFIRHFSETYPNVALRIEELQTEAILHELQEDRLDGAIMATPLPKGGFKERPIYYEPFHLYLSAGHPLLKKTKVLASDLDGAEMWMLKDGHCFRTQVVNFCSLPPSSGQADGTVMKNIHFEGGSLDTLKNVVLQNRGYTMVPALMTAIMKEAELKRHVRPFANPVPTREVSLVSRRDHWKLDILRAIEGSIQKNLPFDLAKRGSREQTVLEIC